VVNVAVVVNSSSRFVSSSKPVMAVPAHLYCCSAASKHCARNRATLRSAICSGALNDAFGGVVLSAGGERSRAHNRSRQGIAAEQFDAHFD